MKSMALLGRRNFPALSRQLGASPHATHQKDQDGAEKRSEQHNVVEAFRTELGLEAALDDRIGDNCLAYDPAEQCRSRPDEDGKRSSKAMSKAAPATIRGMLIARPIRMSAKLPLAAAAIAITLSRL